MQIIGIDPHKGSHTAVAIRADGTVIQSVRVTSSRRQVDRLLAFAAGWPDRVWAVEAAGVGRLLAQQLVARGQRVVDVPPSLSTRVRVYRGGRVVRATLTTRPRSRLRRCTTRPWPACRSKIPLAGCGR